MSRDELTMKLKIEDLENQNQSYQEYINFLEDRTDYYEDKTLELQYKIDKAIKYIDEHIEDKYGRCDTHYIWQVESILKGDNNE